MPAISFPLCHTLPPHLRSPRATSSPFTCSHVNSFGSQELTHQWDGRNSFVARNSCRISALRALVALETASAIETVDIVTTEGTCQAFNRIDLEFGYRSSPFQDMKDLAAIGTVTFRLQSSRSARARQQEFLQRRRITQPLREQRAGSVFRNPSELGVAAAELIEKAGLKGFRVGGAMISNIHANFFINLGGSTSQDMHDLIALAKEKVDQKFREQLKEEVIHVLPYCDGLMPKRTK